MTVDANADTSSLQDEKHWYHATQHWPQITKVCEEFRGPRNLDFVSVFDASQKVLKTATDKGLKGHAYDIRSMGVAHDVTGQQGFFVLLSLLKRLKPKGMSLAAPPCSMFGFLSISEHRRHQDPQGNLMSPNVRLGNVISFNCAMALKAG